MDEDEIWDEMEVFDEEIRDDPGDAFAHQCKGQALNLLGRYDEGFKCLDRAMALARTDLKDAVAAARAGRCSAEYGHKKLLADVARMDLRSTAEAVHVSKGSALSYMRKDKEAARHLKRALKLNPRNGVIHYMMGCALDNMEKPSESVKYFDEALSLRYRDPVVYYRRAHALNNCGRKEECIRCLREVLEMHPDYADAHYEMATAYLSIEDFRRAIKCYRRAIAADPRHKKAHEFLGIAYMAVHQDDLARPCLERALDLAPGDPDVLETARAWAERNAAANRDDSGA